MSTTDTTIAVPPGTWTADHTHSSASFAVKHMIVATFRGRFEELDASLVVAEDGSAQLRGVVQARSLVVKDENLQGHLASPEFFDLERYPEISFVSTSLRRDGENLVVEGELTIKDQTHRVEGQGTIVGPNTIVRDREAVGITLETIVDRTQFGLNWNAELPKGGVAVANDVKLTIELELHLA